MTEIRPARPVSELAVTCQKKPLCNATCQKLIVQLSSDLYAGHGSIGMIAQTLLHFLALAISGSFGQIGLSGPVTTRPHAADPAPDLTFTKTLSYPVNDPWSTSNLSGQLTVLVFFPHTTHNLESATQWNAVVDKFAGKPVEFVWITGECECTLAPWLQQHPIKGWVLYDPEGKTDSLDQAKATIQTLPLASNGFLEFEFIPAGPLKSLGLLLQRK
jgi:hypothetical protein